MTAQTDKVEAGPTRILIATDLSARCDRALDRAVQLADQFGAELIALHVLAPEQSLAGWYQERGLPAWRRPKDPLRVAGERMRACLPHGGRDVTTLVEEGEPAEIIAKVAAEHRCQLIVTGLARDETLGRLFIGNTVDALVATTEIPVLVVKNRECGAYRSVVVAADFSEPSRQALDLAGQWFGDARLTLFNAYEAPYAGLLSEAERYRAGYRKVVEAECAAFLARGKEPPGGLDVILEPGFPAPLLADYVAIRGADLVVVGRTQHGTLRRLLVGSAATAILSDVGTDILLASLPDQGLDEGRSEA